MDFGQRFSVQESARGIGAGSMSLYRERCCALDAGNSGVFLGSEHPGFGYLRDEREFRYVRKVHRYGVSLNAAMP